MNALPDKPVEPAVPGDETAATAVPPSSGEAPPESAAPVPEIGGRKDGSEPTRFGDWEKNGRCIDF